MKIITVVLTVLPPFAACGCYTSGEEWDRDLAPPALEEACNQLAGDYKFPGEKTADIPIDNGKMIYTFKLTRLRKLDSDLAPVRHIDAEECREGMNKELFGCKQGGKSEYTNWRYRADPNKGKKTEDPPSTQEFTMNCDHDGELIKEEFGYVNDLISAGKDVMPSSDYYKRFFSDKDIDRPDFALKVKAKYEYYRDLLNKADPKISLTCVEEDCDAPAGRKKHAWASWPEKRVNLCSNWFEVTNTKTALDQCKKGEPDAGKWEKLSQLRETKSFMLMHEITHLNEPVRATKDYAYGVRDCLKLRDGTFVNRDLCGGPCASRSSFRNADSLTLIAVGEHYSKACEKPIEIKIEENETPTIID